MAERGPREVSQMPVLPGENDFLSLFECVPELLDTSTKDYPFYYNEAKYKFSNGVEDFIVRPSPSCGEVKIQVNKRDSKRLLSILNLRRVAKLEITSDQKDLITMLNEDSQQMIEIDFKPSFKQIFIEHYNR